MKIKIRWRIDTEVYFTTDTGMYLCETWDEVFKHVKHIEACNCTIIEISDTRFD